MTQVATIMQSFARLEDAERFVAMIRAPEGDEVGILAVAAGNRPEDGMRFAVVQRSHIVRGLGWRE